MAAALVGAMAALAVALVGRLTWVTEEGRRIRRLQRDLGILEKLPDGPGRDRLAQDVDRATSDLLDWREQVRLPRRDFLKGVFVACCGLAAPAYIAALGIAWFGHLYHAQPDGRLPAQTAWQVFGQVALLALAIGTLNAFPEGLKIALRSRM